MKRSVILGVSLVSIVGAAIGLAGAGVLARAQELASPPDISPDVFFGNDLPVIDDGLMDPPHVPSSPNVESRRSGSLDSNDFIAKGEVLAAEAIDALTAERDSLQNRLKQINQELARWDAIHTGLSSAKKVMPADDLELNPLPEPAG